MNSVKSFDGNASERDVLVDDIQRIREVLHLGGDKLSSDDEEEDSEEGELDDEENPFRGKERSLSPTLRVSKVTRWYFHVNVDRLDDRLSKPDV